VEGVLYLFVRKVIKHIAVNCRGMLLLPTKCRVLWSILLSRFSPYEIMGVTIMDFDVNQLLIRCSAYIMYMEETRTQWGGTAYI